MPLTPQQLGAIVRSRRTELGLTQAQVVALASERTGGSISEPTMRAVETGRTSASDLTLAAISQALDWPAGHLRAMRDDDGPEDGGGGALDPIGIAALDGKPLTDAEQAKVEAFVRGLLAARDD